MSRSRQQPKLLMEFELTTNRLRYIRSIYCPSSLLSYKKWPEKHPLSTLWQP